MYYKLNRILSASEMGYLVIYLTPYVPLSMIWIYIPIMRGKDNKKRGFAPLKLPLKNELGSPDWRKSELL